MALHCTECGFVNGEGANYCQRCGALLPREEGAGDPATATYRIGETGELVPVELGEVTAHGPAFVIRAGLETRIDTATGSDDAVTAPK